MTLQVHEAAGTSASSPTTGRIVYTGSKLVQGVAADGAVSLRARLQDKLSEQALASVVREFESLPVLKPEDWKSNPELLLVSNENAPLQPVDYSKRYYFNAGQPVIGSATVAAELNPNGTLSTGSATVDDRTAETALSLLPIKEVLTNWLIPTIDTENLVAESTSLRATLTVEAAPVLHTLTRLSFLTPLCAQPRPILPVASEDGVTAYSRSLAAPAKPPVTPPNASSLSDQIAMPEKKP